MKKMIYLLLLPVMMSTALAATFIPIPFEKQLREADGVVEGKFLSASSIHMADDEVYTQATFVVRKVYGLSQSSVVNSQRIVVTYPGGEWQGIFYSVPGTPKFKENEDVFLILNKGQHGFVLNNLALGKYLIHQDGGEKHLVSELFPNDPNLGQIPYSKVENMLNRTFPFSTGELVSDKVISETKKSEVINNPVLGTRSPASLVIPREKRSAFSHPGFILGILFGLLGVFSIWFARQKH